MSTFNAGTVTVVVTHHPEHFNRTCFATIPEYWEAEVQLNDVLVEHLNANRPGVHVHIYGTSQISGQDAVNDCVKELQHFGVTGKLKVVS